jgi:hypothetical protein
VKRIVGGVPGAIGYIEKSVVDHEVKPVAIE